METGIILILVGIFLLFTMREAPTAVGIAAPFMLAPGIIVVLFNLSNNIKENIFLLYVGLFVLVALRFWIKVIITKVSKLVSAFLGLFRRQETK